MQQIPPVPRLDALIMQAGVLYGYKVAGEGGWESGHRWDPEKVLVDPYAPLLKGRACWGQRDAFESFTPVGF